MTELSVSVSESIYDIMNYRKEQVNMCTCTCTCACTCSYELNNNYYIT